MLTRIATIATIASLALSPATAGASSRDVAATHAYIQANYALAKIGVGLIKPAQAKIEAFNSKLDRECPRAGKGSPVNELAQPMSYEVAVALWAISYGAAAGPIRNFIAAVKPLHWSNPRITRIAQKYADSLHVLSTMAVPDLCTDVRAWTASGFQKVPPNVLALDNRLEAVEGESVPLKLLAPYERGADADTARRARGFEVKLAEAEFVIGQDDWIKVLETLGLQQ